eukprot:5513364-Karenia_brevis.AAC.1
MPITDGHWFLFRKATGQEVWICAVCGGLFTASNSPFYICMKTGPMPQDLLIVKAVLPNHKDLATIQMFKLWTNAGRREAVSNPTRQFTDDEIADLVRDMITGSERSAWMMFRDVPKRDSCACQPNGCSLKV